MPKLTDEQKAERAAKASDDKSTQGEGDGAPRRGEATRVAGEGNNPTREQVAAGESCRGCGLPVIDNLGNWPGTMYLAPEQ